jgi:tetratricopeptide (TPR) repeat protein
MHFRLLLPLFACLSLWTLATRAEEVPPCTLVAIQGSVQVAPPGSTVWQTARTNLVLSPGTRVRTGANGAALIRIRDRSLQRLGPNAEIQSMSPNDRGAVRQFLQRGLNYFFDRGGDVEVNTSTASGLTLGTEFVVNVAGEGAQETVELAMFDGLVELRNQAGTNRFSGTQQGRSEAGRAPLITSALYATNVIQWFLYYPAVLDPEELMLPAEAKSVLAESLARYRAGDLTGAYDAWPTNRASQSPTEQVLHAALQLAIGDVAATQRELAAIPGPNDEGTEALSGALQRVIAAVRLDPVVSRTPSTNSASALLAESYVAQSQRRLGDALALARQAVRRSTNFGFGWARVAELEFSHGNIPAATAANARARALAPHHAQAVALEGFLLAARNHTRAARDMFAQAIELDSRLGNAWLGRGLCHFRLGELAAGLADLEAAAALEPNRAVLRSSLAKAWQENRDPKQARRELGLASKLDPLDPTAPFYSALLDYEGNRVNAAVDGLERALVLNENRAVFRSQMKLDEDRAVRGTGLARVYQRAGLTDVSLREAARAVASDYADYSSHLFLAETYDALRDPTRFNLRYETAWFNELLLADLLAPVGAGTFSPNVSQQEYTRLFTAEGLSIASVSDYRSDGQFRQLATQSGFYGNTAWSLDAEYQRNDGVRPNNVLDRIEWYSQIKQQVTARDTALLLVKFQDYHSADNFQYLNPTNSYSPSFRFDEDQKPIAVAGWRHEWAPGIQTLALAGRLENDQRFRQDGVGLSESVTSGGPPFVLNQPSADLRYRGRLEIYTGELNQIAKLGDHTLVLGGRFQGGEFDTDYRLNNTDPKSTLGILYPGEVNQDRTVRADFQRWSLYAYETWTPLRSLALTAGLAYDDVVFPANHRSPPLQSGETTKARVLPKAAVTWTPLTVLTLRGMYAKSIGGVSLDESYRLEPVQLAGFSQAFRTLIPESVAGSVSAPGFDVAGLALDLKLPARTYLGLRGDFLKSDVDQQVGLFNFDIATQQGSVGGTSEQLRFTENAATLTLDKLLGEEWSVGGSYRFQQTRLNTRFPQLAGLGADAASRADLHQFTLRTSWNHASGWFARADASWYLQDHFNSALSTADRSEDTCQVNLQLGWRFPRQLGEVSAGVLNALGNDYRLDPLSGLPEFARERVFFGRLKLYF